MPTGAEYGFFGILLTCVAATTLHVVEWLDEALPPQILSHPRGPSSGADVAGSFGYGNAPSPQLMYPCGKTGDPVKPKGIPLGERQTGVQVLKNVRLLGHLKSPAGRREGETNRDRQG